MTVFLMVLKILIKDRLKTLSVNLAVQEKSYGYNHDLSKDQKAIIDKLEETLVLFAGTGKDEADVATIKTLMDGALKKVQDTREEYREPRDGGNTVSTLNELRNHSSSFYDKMHAFKFNLLDKKYVETPEYIVYYHAVYYFGDEVFIPKKGIDPVIRGLKEHKLAIRLKSLSELIKPHYNLEQQRERVLQVLKDLATDNRDAIKKDESKISLPSISVWGLFSVTAPLEWFSASQGRFAQEFNMAIRKIKTMTPEQFIPEKEEEVEEDEVLSQNVEN